MSKDLKQTDGELSDSELVELLKNHGIDRRNMMKLLGVGGGVAALGGTAAGKGGKRGDARIDEVFGASYSIGESPPPGLVDHVVELHAHADSNPKDGLGALTDFPLVPDDSLAPRVPEDDDDEPEEFPTEFFFDPVGLHVKPGDVVNFAIHSHEHTITSFHSKYLPLPPDLITRVPDGAFTSPPIVGDESWLYRFTTEGVYDLLCLPHLGFGMVMRIVVSESDDVSGFDEYGPLPLSASVEQPLYNSNLVLTDEMLDPQNIVDEGSIAWSDLTPHTS